MFSGMIRKLFQDYIFFEVSFELPTKNMQKHDGIMPKVISRIQIRSATNLAKVRPNLTKVRIGVRPGPSAEGEHPQKKFVFFCMFFQKIIVVQAKLFVPHNLWILLLIPANLSTSAAHGTPTALFSESHPIMIRILKTAGCLRYYTTFYLL